MTGKLWFCCTSFCFFQKSVVHTEDVLHILWEQTPWKNPRPLYDFYRIQDIQAFKNSKESELMTSIRHLVCLLILSFLPQFIWTQNRRIWPNWSCLHSTMITAHQRLKKKGFQLCPCRVHILLGFGNSAEAESRSPACCQDTQHKLFLPCDQSENQNHFIPPECSHSALRKTPCSFVK